MNRAAVDANTGKARGNATGNVSGTVESQTRLRSLKALAALLLLAQLPHVLHLPVWVSLLGAGIVCLRLWAELRPAHRWLRRLLSPIPVTAIAMAGAVLIRFHYGYFLGRDPCVAFLFLLVAAKFAEYRKSNDATLLLCLSGFLLLTQYFYSQNILSAIVTLPAVLALGNALIVLRDPRNSTDATANLRLTGKLLLQGAPLAALLFVVFPRMPGPLWSLPEDSMGKTGLSDSMTPGSIGALSLSDKVAFRVDFDGPAPPPRQRYWRGPVLTEFDGFRWSASRQQQQALPDTGDGNPMGTPLEYTVMLQPHRQRWLFALDRAASLPVSDAPDTADRRVLAALTTNGQLISRKPVSRLIRYRQRSILSDSYAPLRSAPPSTLQLAGNHPRASAFASRLRAESDGERDYARRLLSWFNREEFHYTLQPQVLGDRPVDEFLFKAREGFCEHYASAFVVMMRAAGIPARVVTGYLGGEMNENYMIVRQSDAHAWTEALIDGRWTRFDPTGAVAPSRVDTGMASALGDGEPVPRMARLDSDWVRSLQLSWDALNHDWQRLVVDFDNDSQFRLWERLGTAKPALWQLTAVVMSAALLWFVLLLGLPHWRRGDMPAAERLWQRFCRRLAKRGITRRNDEPPGAFIERAVLAVPRFGAEIRQVGEHITRLRFVSLPADDGRAEHRAASRQLRRLDWHLMWLRRSDHARDASAASTRAAADRTQSAPGAST